jgi:hypothetical protein
VFYNIGPSQVKNRSNEIKSKFFHFLSSQKKTLFWKGKRIFNHHNFEISLVLFLLVDLSKKISVSKNLNLQNIKFAAMFVERKVCYSVLFTNLVG